MVQVICCLCRSSLSGVQKSQKGRVEEHLAKAKQQIEVCTLLWKTLAKKRGQYSTTLLPAHRSLGDEVWADTCLALIYEFRSYEVKIEESGKASSQRESNPGHLWLEAGGRGGLVDS